MPRCNGTGLQRERLPWTLFQSTCRLPPPCVHGPLERMTDVRPSFKPGAATLRRGAACWHGTASPRPSAAVAQGAGPTCPHAPARRRPAGWRCCVGCRPARARLVAAGAMGHGCRRPRPREQGTTLPPMRQVGLRCRTRQGATRSRGGRQRGRPGPRQGEQLRKSVRDPWLAVYANLTPDQKAMVRDALRDRVPQMAQMRAAHARADVTASRRQWRRLPAAPPRYSMS